MASGQHSANTTAPKTALFILASYMREGLGLPGKPSGSGGVFTQMAVLARALSERADYRVILLTDELFEYPGLEVRLVPQPPEPTTIAWLKKHRHRGYIDALANVMRPAPGERGVVLFPHIVKSAHVKAAKAAGSKSLLWINADQIVDNSPYARSQSSTEAIRACIPLVDAVGVLNAHERDLVREQWGIEASILTSGIDASEAALCETSQDGAVWVGRIVPGKRPWAFVDLARKFPEHRFRMVMRTRSGGSNAFDDYIEAEAQRYPNLELVYDVPSTEMPALYASARTFVMTSASEGLGRVMVEAGAVGTEVLSLEINVDGMLDSPTWGYCADGDYEALEAKLGEVLTGPAPTTAERLAIREEVLARYGAQRMVDDIDGVVRSLYGDAERGDTDTRDTDRKAE